MFVKSCEMFAKMLLCGADGVVNRPEVFYVLTDLKSRFVFRLLKALGLSYVLLLDFLLINSTF